MPERKVYALFLEGTLYGKGPLVYVHELLRDYIVVHELYGKEHVKADIVKVHSEKYKELVNEMKEMVRALNELKKEGLQ